MKQNLCCIFYNLGCREVIFVTLIKYNISLMKENDCKINFLENFEVLHKRISLFSFIFIGNLTLFYFILNDMKYYKYYGLSVSITRQRFYKKNYYR